MDQRLRRLQSAMPEVDALVISSATNRFYISGFRGSAGTLFITRDKAYYIADGRYIESVTKNVSSFMEPVRGRQPSHEDLVELCKKHNVKRLGIEDLELTVAVYNIYRAAMPDVELVPIRDLIVKLRVRKDQGEIEAITAAQAITDKAYLEVLNFIRAGRTEKEVARHLENAMFDFGASALAFPTISVAGEHSSLPHGKPSDYVLKDGDFLTLDFGAALNGYNSDMTRTVAIGSCTDEMRLVYDTVLKAQVAAIGYARAGVTGKSVDKVARDIITEAGYGEYFVHNLGHAIGIDLHEDPRFSPMWEGVVEAGTCISVEPGIYLPGRFGVRIEDDIILTETSNINITKGPKDLKVL